MCYKCNQDCDNTCEQNACYDDCGCLYPSTFACVKYTGSALTNIDVVATMDGEAALASINTKVGELQLGANQVAVNSADVCPSYLFDKLEAGLNIALSVSGTGCDQKIKIDASSGGVPVDVKAKVSAADTTSDYLTNKLEGGTYIQKTVVNPAGNEKIKFDVSPVTLISADSGNQLTLGVDGKLKTAYVAPDGSETKLVQGTGVTVSGTGTSGDPYVVSTNASIQVARPCFNGVWNDVTLLPTGNASVVYVSGTPQYRFRYDGTIEFRGQATYTVAFGGTSATRKFTVNAMSLSTSCATLSEQLGTVDMKGINYLDTSLLSAYGYIIRKASDKIVLEFQSTYQSAASKTIVVNFEGCLSYPNY